MLSFCMIVKDEEKNIHRCLNSIKGIADEVIVVDTGSTDNTIKIAKSYGAKVYEHPWSGNYALHYNQSISYATKNWVFVIDADEEFFFLDNAITFRSFLDGLPRKSDSVRIPLRDVQKGRVVMRYSPVRVLRREIAYYVGSIRAKPERSGNVVAYGGCYIKHYGFDLTPAKALSKASSDIKHFRKALKNNADDLDAYFYLCQCHAVIDEVDDAIEAGEAYRLNSDKRSMYGSIFFLMSRLYMKKENYKKALDWANLGLSMSPNDLDLNLAITEVGVETEDKGLIVMGATRYIATYWEMKDTNTIGLDRFVFGFNDDGLLFCMNALKGVVEE